MLESFVSSTGKVSNSWIRDLEFNPYLHQKPIGAFILSNYTIILYTRLITHVWIFRKRNVSKLNKMY